METMPRPLSFLGSIFEYTCTSRRASLSRWAMARARRTRSSTLCRTARAIVIGGKNDPPVAEDDNLGDSPAADPVSASLTLNDSDAENNDLTVMEIDGQSVGGVATISLPSGAIMTIDTDSGAFTVDPNGQFDSLDSNETAVVTFDYVISDGEGGTDLATVTLTLQPNNRII